MNSFPRIPVFLSLFFLVCACSTRPESRVARTEVGKYSYIEAGQGVPTVIFEAGLGASKESWHWVFADVGKTTRVVAYDRAGNGDSVARSNDRSGTQIVDELHAFLAAANIPPPYVLVGHFRGAMYVNLYARTYPEEVAGVIFIDGLHEDFPARCKAGGGAHCELSEVSAEVNQDQLEPGSFIVWEYQEHFFASKSRFNAAGKERMAQSATIRQLHEAKAFPPVPVVVLNGTGVSRLSRGSSVATWNATQKELAGMSPNGRYVECDVCRHAVHADNPKMVVDAVLSVVAQARTKGN